MVKLDPLQKHTYTQTQSGAFLDACFSTPLACALRATNCLNIKIPRFDFVCVTSERDKATWVNGSESLGYKGVILLRDFSMRALEAQEPYPECTVRFLSRK